MIIYVDTEFHDLSPNAQIISVGMVSEDGRQLYLELDPLPPPSDCSKFVRQIVLPLLQGDECRRPRAKLAQELESWLGQFNDPISLCADSDWDWAVLRKATSSITNGSGASGPIQLGKRTVTLLPVSTPTGASGEAYSIAELDYWLRNSTERRHHALCDAKALRYCHLATVNSPNP